jgi:F-box interacting protein
MERNCSGNVPEGLLMEILSKLPVKSLMRFKCVSKSMYALITSPHFITKHLTSHNPHRGAILRRGDGLDGRYRTNMLISGRKPPRLSTLSNETLELSGDVDLSQLFQDEVTGLVILGPCNGVLCFVANVLTKGPDQKADYVIVLWNPATRESRMLPPINFGFNIVSSDMFDPNFGIYMSSEFGFGFDPKTNDYKVVRILDFFRFPRKAVVYNLSTNSWRKIDSSPTSSYNLELPRFPSCLNGVLYWLAIHYPWPFGDDGRHLISFDMSDEVFQDLPLLPQGSRSEDIAVINDSLTLILRQGRLVRGWIEICVLDEFGVERTGNPKLSITLPKFGDLIQLREDGWAVLDTQYHRLVLHNPTTKEMKYLQIDEAESSQLVTYTESLILLNGPGNVLEQQATP